MEWKQAMEWKRKAGMGRGGESGGIGAAGKKRRRKTAPARPPASHLPPTDNMEATAGGGGVESEGSQQFNMEEWMRGMDESKNNFLARAGCLGLSLLAFHLTNITCFSASTFFKVFAFRTFKLCTLSAVNRIN